MPVWWQLQTSTSNNYSVGTPCTAWMYTRQLQPLGCSHVRTCCNTSAQAMPAATHQHKLCLCNTSSQAMPAEWGEPSHMGTHHSNVCCMKLCRCMQVLYHSQELSRHAVNVCINAGRAARSADRVQGTLGQWPDQAARDQCCCGWHAARAECLAAYPATEGGLR